MSQDQASYTTDNQMPAIIERPRKAHAIGEAGLEEYQLFGWIKMSAKFCAHIKRLRGAKLSIWLCLALNIDEDGECKLTQKELCEMTGYSHTEVIESVTELDKMGFLSVDRSGKKNLYKPVFVAKGKGNNPTKETLVKKLDSTPADSLESSPSYINSVPTSIKKEKELKPDIFDMLSQAEAIAQQTRDAQIAFETALSVNPWPWDSSTIWRKFSAWVLAEYTRDPKAFEDYKVWREGQGKFKGGMTNTRIRQDPQIFMDTGWPSFLASSSMYSSSDRSHAL